MTKSQVKAQLRELIEKLYNIKDDIESLQPDVEETRDSIEPYGDWDELTDAQEERYDWLDNCASNLGYALDEIDSAISNLEESEGE